MSVSDAEKIVKCFPERLQSIINEIYTDGKIGISSQNLRIRPFNSKIIQDTLNQKRSFILEVPYASKLLNWEIVFNDEDESYAPDFEFTNDAFLSDPNPDIIENSIPTLAKWDVGNPKSLVNVIRELLALYKQVQISTLQQRETLSQLSEEYGLIKANLDMSEDNMEVYIDKNGFVHFLININVNFSSLPSYIQPVLFGENYHMLNPCEDTAALRISFTKVDGSRYTSDLQFSPRLEQVIGNACSLHIPKFNKEKGLVMYIIEITKILSDKVESVSSHFTMKKEYIEALLSRCGKCILEYDNELFSQASLMLEVNSFPVLVMITIGKNFPQEKPTVVLRSLFEAPSSRPFLVTLNNYQYSPRWKPKEMVEKLLTSLKNEVIKFQITCQNFIDNDSN